jgi:hypothetical protein
MPGARDIGSQVEIFDVGDLSALSALSLEEPGLEYEAEWEDTVRLDEDAMEVDDDFNILDGADLGLWLERVRRDSGGMDD